MRPPAPESLRVADRWYAKALESATKVEEVKSYNGGAMVTYCWMLWPSRNTWPTKHLDRPPPRLAVVAPTATESAAATHGPSLSNCG